MYRLYDIDSILEIPRDIADGYLILLSGGLNSAQAIRQQRNRKKVSSEPSSTPVGESSAQSIKGMSPEEVSAIELAFFALTGGNAIDSMFGVKSHGGIKRSKTTSAKAYNDSNEAKRALAGGSASSDVIRVLAVETYTKCFEIIVKYHLDLEKTGFISRCSKQQKLRERTMQQIEELFRPLEEGVASSSS